MNDTETIIKYLKLYNEWRRGDEKMGHPNPIEIGKLLDEACEKLVSLERERDEAKEHLSAAKHFLEKFISERDEARSEVEKLQDALMQIKNSCVDFADAFDVFVKIHQITVTALNSKIVK